MSEMERRGAVYALLQPFITQSLLRVRSMGRR